MLRRQNICLLMGMNALPQSFLGMPHSSRRWLTLNISALLLPTARKTSWPVKLKLGRPATNCTLSGSQIFQGKPSLTSLEHALRVSSYMAVKPGQWRKISRLLMRAQNISWREHKTKAEVFDGIPQISSILAQRRARFASHCYRSKDQIISDVICMRFPRTSRGRRPFNYIDSIERDINQDINDLPNLMADRVSWKSIVNSFSDAAAWWWWCHGNRTVKLILWRTLSRILLQKIKNVWYKLAEISLFIIFEQNLVECMTLICIF